MWGKVLVIDALLPAAGAEDLRSKQEDKLLLTWEQRRWVRGRLTTTSGRKIGLALPTGTTLAPDAILWIAPDWYLRVEALAEPLIEITPNGTEEAVKIAFEVGNRHYPLAMQGNHLQVPDDLAMTRLMERLWVAWVRRQAVFNPLGNTQAHPHG
ncbi:MAG: urease accessory protein UreE [Bryobacteraceae bacterium]